MKCETCKYWKRRILKQINYGSTHGGYVGWAIEEKYSYEGKNVLQTKESAFGKCKNKKFIYIQSDGYDNVQNIDLEHQSDTLLYSDYEAYSAFFITGENFGCIHYEIS